MCNAASCVMLQHGGSIPPCFLCSHLLTGIEFLPEIELLREATLAEIEALPTERSSSSLQANKRYELDCIDRLIDGIRARDAPSYKDTSCGPLSQGTNASLAPSSSAARTSTACVSLA